MAINDASESVTIDWLRFPLAAAVVMLHLGAIGVNNPMQTYSALCILLSQGVCRIAVPCFYFISGYLFFSRLELWDWRTYGDKLRRRFHSLLIPYIVWNIIAAVCIWGYAQLRSPETDLSFQSFWNHIAEWGGFWDRKGILPFDGPLWFIRNLMLYILAAPLIYWFVKYLRYSSVLILETLVLVFDWFPEGFLFFSAGASLQIHGYNLVDTFKGYRIPSVIISSLLLFILVPIFRHHPDLYRYWENLFVITGTIAVISLASHFLEKGKLRPRLFLSRSSFFVFCAHNVLILHEFSRWILYHTLPFTGEVNACLDLLLRPAISVMICLGLYWLIRQFSPGLSRVLSGNRVN